MRYAVVELELLPDQFWELTQEEFYLLEEARVYKQARYMEGPRLVSTQIVNMVQDPPLKPHEYMPMITDKLEPTPPARVSVATQPEEDDTAWKERMRQQYATPKKTSESITP